MLDIFVLVWCALMWSTHLGRETRKRWQGTVTARSHTLPIHPHTLVHTNTLIHKYTHKKKSLPATSVQDAAAIEDATTDIVDDKTALQLQEIFLW